MTNCLGESSSPYLRQHQGNPIHWQMWDERTLATAKELDKPIFLSVGYSACHWCHVMAHESFEDQAVADALNRSFVSIKVDREERPDVDQTYMTAVQVATSRGGWPMSVFLTPDLKPIFAGTYFPKNGVGEVPGFLTIVEGLAQAWRDERSQVEEAADTFAKHVERLMTMAGPPRVDLSLELVDQAVDAAHGDFDYEHGGFGGAPKFPPHSTLRFLIAYARHRLGLGDDQESRERVDQCRRMLTLTLHEMLKGGIHDHVGGGFHRYTVDEDWHLPHFEKMLTDNAQLVMILARAGDLLDEPDFQRAAGRIIEWADREMRVEGGYAAALDADSEGEEGVFYTWTLDEVKEALGEDAGPFIAAFGITEDGNFEDEATGQETGRNVLHQRDEGEFERQLAKLLERREARTRPGLDDKALASANGLMIEALADLGKADSSLADAWLQSKDLPHQVVKGKAEGQGFLDDHAEMIHALLALGKQKEAGQLAEQMVSLFGPADDGLNFAQARHGTPISNYRPFLDSATPSPNASAALALLKVGRHDEAAAILRAGSGYMAHYPMGADDLLTVLLIALTKGIDLGRSEADAPLVEVSMQPEALAPDEEGWAHGSVTLKMPPGVQINSPDPSATWLTPTSLRVEGVLGEANFPPATEDRYAGEVEIQFRLRAPDDEPREFSLTVTCQACSETACHTPQETILKGTIKPM